MIKSNWYSNDLGMLTRQAIAAWVVLFASVIVFAVLSTFLSQIITDKYIVIAISLTIVVLGMTKIYLQLQRNQYFSSSTQELLQNHDVASTSILKKDNDTQINFVGKTEFTSIPITLSVSSDSILSSPAIGEIFTRAAVNTIYGYVGKALLELHSQKIEFQIKKLTGTAEIVAKVLKDVEKNQDFPFEIKTELQRRLYDIFYEEMEELVREVNIEELAREIKMRSVEFSLEHIKEKTETLKLEVFDTSKADVEYPIIVVGKENKIRTNKK